MSAGSAADLRTLQEYPELTQLKAGLSREQVIQLILQYWKMRGFHGSFEALQLESGVVYNNAPLDIARLLVLMGITQCECRNIASAMAAITTGTGKGECSAQESPNEPGSEEAQGESSEKELAQRLMDLGGRLGLQSSGQILSRAASVLGSSSSMDQRWAQLWFNDREEEDVTVTLDIDKKQEESVNPDGASPEVPERRDERAVGDIDLDAAWRFANFIPHNRAGQIKLASLPRAVIYMTQPTVDEATTFMKAFLTAHHIVTTSEELLGLLIARFRCPTQQQLRDHYGEDCQEVKPLLDLAPAAYNQRCHEIQLRVFNVLQRWVDSQFDDFDTNLVKQFQSWIETDLMRGGSMLVKQGARLMERLQNLMTPPKRDQEEEKMIPAESVPTFQQLIVSFYQVSPREHAKQLMLREWTAFSALRNDELLKVAWQASDAAKRAPHVVRMTSDFNDLSNVVQSTILQESAPPAKIIEFWIRVARHLRDLNNFHSMLAVLAGLSSDNISNLPHWADVSKKRQRTWEELKPLLDSKNSYSNMRRAIRDAMSGPGAQQKPFYRKIISQKSHDDTVVAAIIPYMGMYCSDLVFIHEGSDTFALPEKAPKGSQKLPDIGKCIQTAKVIAEIRQCQSGVANIPFERVDQLWRWYDSVQRMPEATLASKSRSMREKTQ